MFISILGKPPGYDRVRNAEIGNKDFELDVLEEAYTSEHWLVRIYKVKDLDNYIYFNLRCSF
jgi:dolichyl-diphosphooligosaccharide--protein glycosyltransferase